MRRSAKIVLDLLASRSGGLTRAEIKDLTGLSKPTIQAIITELRNSGQVTEGPPTDSGNGGDPVGGGRRPETFVLTREAGLVIGVDIGHGHIRVAVADRSGELVGEIAEIVDVDVDAVGVKALTKVRELIEQALEGGGGAISAVCALVMGIPAALDRDGRVLFSESLPSWAPANLGDELYALMKEHFRQLRIGREDIRLENDANLGAIGEGCKGAAIGRQNYLYLKASTGVGMGIVARGRIYRGAEGAAGEFGHMTASPDAAPFLRSAHHVPSTPCPRCSKLDCLENLASGQALLRRFSPDVDAVTDRAVEEFIASATLPSAVSGHERKQAVVDAGTRIGYTLGDAIRVLAPEVVVIGGLLATTGDLVGKPIKDAIAGMKGLAPVEIELLGEKRIRRAELDGALARAARLAAIREMSG